MLDLGAHPGLLYVAATLLPLVSFFLLLLAGAVRTAVRPVRDTGLGSSIFQMLGGDTPSRAGAYVATGAIGGAFLLSLIGFVLFVQDQAHGHGQAEQPLAAAAAEPAKEDAHEHTTDQIVDRWAASSPWLRVQFGSGPASTLELGYRIDGLAAVMFLMVSFVATLIHLFSIGYMGEELQPLVTDHQVHTEHGHLHRRGRFGRFFLFLSLFCFSMLNLVLADNLFQVFLSWELVGICSYLLIGFYHERSSASNAANKAFITNRIGDAGFILGLLILWTSVGTLNFDELFQRVRAPLQDAHHEGLALAGQIVRANEVGTNDRGKQFEISPSDGSAVLLFPFDGHIHAEDLAPVTKDERDPTKVTKTVVEEVKDLPGAQDFGSMPYWLLVAAGLGIFLGCVGKSAQFPLHVWLPDAMEGPTPVSALIHAATMVAAGVYLVGRCFPLFTPESRLVIAYTGGITLFVAATIALVMTDIKKVLAYSTVSQLGYMMLALGIGGWVAGLFHLVTHAFFKALLFLGSGSVIYGCHHEQDMLKMGGLYPKMKTTALTMLAGVLAIAGIPFLSGWYSKDAILAQALGFARVHPEHGLLFLLPVLTAGITTFYMFRMWFLTFAGEPRDPHVHERAQESPRIMTVPLIILAVCSVVIAWGWPIYDAEASYLERQIHHAQYPAVYADFGLLPELGESWEGGPVKDLQTSERYWAHQYHALAGNMALGIVLVAIAFASLVYYSRVLDPAEAKAQFPGVHRFLWNKWYFDELYSALLVRPALTVAGWCRAFDTRVIDGTVDATGRATVEVAKWDGRFDLGIIDGIANLIARVAYAVGGSLRTVQTGYLRSYVLFLVLAAVGIFAALSYFIAMATAG